MIEIVKEYTYLGEATEGKKVLMLTTRNEEEPKTGYYETIQYVKDELDKRKVPYYILFCENAYTTNDEKFTVYNVDDKKGFDVSPEDTVVFNRLMGGFSIGAMGISDQLERNGFKVVNTRACIELCSDKHRTNLLLEESDIPIPKSMLIQDEEVLERLLPEIHFPCVCKTLAGSEGVGVFIAESKMNLVSVLQTLWKIQEDAEILTQEFIESDGDIRALFVGGEYIASMKRLKIKDDFRSNFSLGGETEKYELSDKEIELCKKCVDIVEGDIIGVDFMIGPKGSIFVLEVNTSPGTTGISETSEVDVVGKLTDYLMGL